MGVGAETTISTTVLWFVASVAALLDVDDARRSSDDERARRESELVGYYEERMSERWKMVEEE